MKMNTKNKQKTYRVTQEQSKRKFSELKKIPVNNTASQAAKLSADLASQHDSMISEGGNSTNHCQAV
jgi:hypothetical protein